MVEVVGQTVLLALMGRLRRRRRWIAALEAGGVAWGIASMALAAGVMFVRVAGNGRPVGFTAVAVSMGLAVAIGGVAGSLRRVTLTACARAVDQVLAQDDARASSGRGCDDCVLAAVALTADAVTATPFVITLIDVAIRRVRRIPPERVIPLPRWRWMALAPIAPAALALALFAPPRWLAWRQGVTSAVAAVSREHVSKAGGATGGGRATETRVAISVEALEVEHDEAAAALEAASGRGRGDPALAAAAREFERVLALLSGGGMNASAALGLLERLGRDAGGAARAALDAAAAAEEAAASLRAVKQKGAVGEASKELVAALAASADQASAEAEADARAAAAAARLAAAGEVGRAVLGGAAGAGAQSLEATTRVGGGDAATGGEREALANGPADGAAGEPRRRLEQLRRELDEGKRGCQGDAEACRGTAENSGRALSRLQREGRTAQARQRFAEATRQFLERIRREAAGAVAGQDSHRLRRYSQAAKGQRPGGGLGEESAREQETGPQSGMVGAARAGTASGNGIADSEMSAGSAATGGSDISSGGGDDDDGSWAGRAAAQEPAGQAGDPSAHGDPGAAVPRSATSGEHAAGPSSSQATAGGGIGNVAGGRVLGPRARNLDGGRAGHNTAVLLPARGPGPSRAQVINGAAAEGFASSDYRRVFSDYRAAVEESMEAAEVPAGKRFLVQRYFQLIRPRSNP